jgi:hypothetical protein
VTTARPRIDNSSRRARLAARHHLASHPTGVTAVDVARDLVGVHASDPVTVYLGIWARVPGFRQSDLDRALYDERSLLKVLGMRRTMFVAPRDEAALIQAACTGPIARGERARLARVVRDAGIADDADRWIASVEGETLAALSRLGEATATELAKLVPGLREQVEFGAGKPWGGRFGISTRVLFLLAAEGRIIRGRPKGSIVSSLYRWVLMDRWVPGGLPLVPREEAQVELARRYLASFGPATLSDIRWWTGWTLGEVRRALASLGPEEVLLDDGAIGFVLPGDIDGVAAESSAPGERVALLPALDPTVMGWAGRDWYLGPHRAALFDRNGNAGPTIWLDGRVVGGWVQRRDGEIAWRLLGDVGVDAANRIAGKAAELRAWFGELRFIPRFRTPLERDLGA